MHVQVYERIRGVGVIDLQHHPDLRLRVEVRVRLRGHSTVEAQVRELGHLRLIDLFCVDVHQQAHLLII